MPKLVSYVVVPLKKAQSVKEFLIKNNLLDHDSAFKKNEESISFPVLRAVDVVKRKFHFVKIEHGDLIVKSQRVKKGTLKEALAKQLSSQELMRLRRAYDVVGSIAILEVPPELEQKAHLLASSILESHKNIKTVLCKAGAHAGEFRTQPMKFLAGVDTRETMHVESGTRIKLNVEKVYYSVRLGTERLRIAQEVKPGESVLVMFSGCGPYPLVLAKKSKAVRIVGIEMNPLAHKYGLENVKINKVKNVKLLQGNVRKVVHELQEKFDRIVMPLPKSAGDFLDSALLVANKGAVIHLYDFLKEGEFEEAHRKIRQVCKEHGVACKILRTVKCGQHAPRTFRVCVDFVVE
ncbi:class I SAM-dependent methyltransferase family protein [Candidatus Woesearchaeota archaeon]|nr:class I SAM-dependent methyltransferase family protein [Candidatus Woesearchaeota archaeon]